MTKTIVKAVIGGLIVGALAFFVPKALIGLLVFCLIVSAFHCCGHRHHGCGHHRFGSKQLFYFADKIRKMSDEEYEEFKTVFGYECCQNDHHHRCCSTKECK